MAEQAATSGTRPVEIERIAQATRHLGWDVLARLCDNGLPAKGAALSPLSIMVALGMLAGAASPARQEQLYAKLQLDSTINLDTTFGALLSEFGGAGQEDAAGAVAMANAAFIRIGIEFLPSYAQYLAGLQADVVSYPSLSSAVGEINNWISLHTGGLIPDMLTSVALQNCRVVLVNALAFKGIWQTQFNPQHTQPEYPFHTTQEETHPVDMMFLQGKNVATLAGSGCSAVRLPYTPSSASSSTMSLIAYLPNNKKSIQGILHGIRNQDPELQFVAKKYAKFGFPKLKLDCELALLSMLEQLGFPVTGANPGFGAGQDNVDTILHRAVIKVDEKGTKAAAATVTLSRKMAQSAATLVFDRPFVFEIVADDSNMTVFSGIFSGQ